jgi:hypothetical protein
MGDSPERFQGMTSFFLQVFRGLAPFGNNFKFPSLFVPAPYGQFPETRTNTGRPHVAQNYDFEIEHVAQSSSAWTSGHGRLTDSIVPHHFPGAIRALPGSGPRGLGTYSPYVSLYDAAIKWHQKENEKNQDHQEDAHFG